jgi:hypothetical protein
MPREHQDAARTLAARVMGRPGVTSVRVGYKTVGGRRTDRLAVVVGVERKRPLSDLSPDEVIPPEVDGVETDVVETGRYHAYAVAPTRGGSSVGHYSGPTGTLGAWVRGADGQPVLLSNAHVIAATNAGQPSDPILSPGPVDGGTDPDDRIATLRASWSIVPASMGTNRVDVALAAPARDEYVTPDITGIGLITGEADAALGDAVWKSGRTTGVTTGEVIGIDAVVDVWYGDFLARFTGQTVIGPGSFSAPGDSGSVVVNGERKAVGLLFAGSRSDTIMNPIREIVATTGIDPVLDRSGSQPPLPPAPPVPSRSSAWLVLALTAMLLLLAVWWSLR